MIAKCLAPFYKRDVHQLLDEFIALQTEAPGPVDFSITLDFGNKDPHLFFSFLIHGDEVGSLPAINFFVRQALRKNRKYRGKITFILGNPVAAATHQRFLDEDLNRVFFPDLKPKHSSYERRRAYEIQKALVDADWLLDIHQTREPTPSSFFIFPFDIETYFWARSLGGSRFLITQEPRTLFSPGHYSIDEYFRLNGKTSLCLEVSEKGFSSEAFFLCLARLYRSIALAKLQQKSFSGFLENVVGSPELTFLKIKEAIRFEDPQDRLRPGLHNFKKLKQNALIGHRASGEPIRTRSKSYSLFPKYQKKNQNFNEITALSSPLVMLAEELQEHPIKIFSSELEKHWPVNQDLFSSSS